MKLTIRKYIRKISLKNLIVPVIILAAMLAAGYLIPFEEMLMPEEVYSADELAAAAEEGSKFISYEISDLNYTGYDYYDAGGIAGSFYCAFADDGESCVFFLIKEGADISSGTVRIITKDEYVNTFLVNYAADLGLSADALTDISGGYIASGCDYNFVRYAAMAVIISLIILVCIIFILANIIICFAPSAHPSCRRLKKYGLSGRDFSDIDRELDTDRIVEAGNMFATSHYLVVFSKGTIYMIPLFNIIWAYQYVSRQLFVSRRLLSYTLAVYTSPAGKIIMRGNRKKNTDKILSFLDRDFSHIAVGYTEEQHKKVKEMLKRGEL